MSMFVPLVDGVFNCLVGQAEPLLQEVHAQHARHPDGLAPNAPSCGVLRLDECLQSSPRHHSLHLAKELLAARHALLLPELVAGKALLLGRWRALLHGFLYKQVSGRSVQHFLSFVSNQVLQ